MRVHIYLKSGQTITLDHIEDAETQRNQVDDQITSYSFKYEDGGVPLDAVKLLCLPPTEIAAITTEDR